MTERDDIVARLRDCEGGYGFRAIVREAADEIERLRRDYSCICNEMRRMMEERDEARRMYCEAVILHGTAHRFDANGVPEEITEAEELARRLKWDCFKENTNDR